MAGAEPGKERDKVKAADGETGGGCIKDTALENFGFHAEWNDQSPVEAFTRAEAWACSGAKKSGRREQH